MTALAARLLRHRPGSSIATVLALALGALILTAMGILVESGLRYHPAPVRYTAADLVVARPDTTFTSKEFDGEVYTSTVALPEGGTVPLDLTGEILGVDGVATVAVDEDIPVVTTTGVTVPGRGWGSAVLTPYELVSGTPPKSAGQVVLSAGPAEAGQTVQFLIGGTLRSYTVSGVVRGPAVAFFADAEAAALSPHRGTVRAIGVIAEPGTDLAALQSRIQGLAGDAQVLTGAGSGVAERSADRAAATLLVQVGASFGGYVIMLIVFVVAATVGLSVRHRRRDLALIRAVAATPGQVRRMIMVESALLSVLASGLGVPAGLAAAGWLTGELTSRGFLPGAFPMRPGALAAPAAAAIIVVSAVLAGLLAARRVTAIRPAEALGEAAIEPGTAGRGRLISGLITLVAAGASAGAAVSVSGQTALGAALGMLYLFVLAVALLAPWIITAAARLLAGPLRAVFGVSGYLAAANLRANARGTATVLTSLVLAVGFGGSVWFLQDNLERQAVTQTREGLLATRALVSVAGLPESAVAQVRAIAGVRAATPVRHTSIVVSTMGDGEVVGARAVDPAGLADTLDLGVTAGDLAALDATTMAVSETFGGEIGASVPVRLGDGTPVDLRIVAVYQRGLGFGDVILSRATVDGHTASGLDDEMLISASPSADAVLRKIPGATLVGTDALTGGLAEDLALSAWLNRLLIAVMVGYTAVAAANTMVMAALARRRELAVLRLTGVTSRQVKRMINAEQVGLLGTAVLLGGTIAALTLSCVVRALTGSFLPYVPPLGWLTVLGGTTILALATTILPVARLLRIPPIEHMGIKE
ncbi:FtsX-like permease family protein [Actinoplanes derwentensis]|uniref:Putative ABC transport system permease protein n=1 Tax=Actinoplanes derwentensis TaxID=113562 RepID=A0A1H1YQC9_9ACTN|nr:FtsX-like permease family protein [Actinoplanes derwentensis]GID81245.1 ABC transporter permease [Actinoplanes derwentensis]SDT23685.1 putative ABC transport system permease protein [Actinoplanes derwentensis]